MVIAGEASGDLHGARMVDLLRQKVPNTRLRGMGSDAMRAAGVELLFDCRDIAVVGLFEVLRHWPDIKRALNTVQTAIENDPPDVLVLIDYVEFNLRMAAVAKRVGVKVLFYVSPQVWAWRPERIHKIGSVIDMMAVIFPFEVTYYERAGIPVKFVGHPLKGKVLPGCSRADLMDEFDIPRSKKLVGLLPGSRANEIRHILPVLLATAQLLNRQRGDVHFLLPVAPTLKREQIELSVTDSGVENVTLLDKRAYDVMGAADSILIASGTATLEAAMIGVPMAIVYRVSALSWLWMKRKLEIDNVGLANIVAGEEVVPEYIQGNCRPDLLAAEVNRQLDDTVYQRNMRSALSGINSRLGDSDAAEEVAQLVTEMLP